MYSSRKDRIQKYLDYFVKNYGTDGKEDFANCGDGRILYQKDYTDNDDNNAPELSSSSYLLLLPLLKEVATLIFLN